MDNPEGRHSWGTAQWGRLMPILILAALLVVTVGPGAYQVALASDPVIAAAGDIACDPASASFNGGLGKTVCLQKNTSDLLVNTGLSGVLDLGDNQYGCGGYLAYLESYALSWGRVMSMTFPSIGNHEYLTSGGTDCGLNAAGYFQYFGPRAGPQGQGYYSFNIGAWHIIALNSNCGMVPCSTSSAQYGWLKADLINHPNSCTLAFWHHPLFSSGGYTSPGVKAFWQLLYAYHADIVLNGHAHIYERFALQNPSGVADPAHGIREFIVGTGGANHTSLGTIAANSEVRNPTTFGVLRLILHSSSYRWTFVPINGQTFTDTGTTSCH